MRRSDDALTGCEGKVKLVDDILIWASSWEELKERVIAILRKCAEYNITISKKKVELGRKVSFAGFDVSKAGITPSKERIKAIMDILATSMKTMTGIRRFQGATQFLTDFDSHVIVFSVCKTKSSIPQNLTKYFSTSFT